MTELGVGREQYTEGVWEFQSQMQAIEQSFIRIQQLGSKLTQLKQSQDGNQQRMETLDASIRTNQ